MARANASQVSLFSFCFSAHLKNLEIPNDLTRGCRTNDFAPVIAYIYLNFDRQKSTVSCA